MEQTALLLIIVTLLLLVIILGLLTFVIYRLLTRSENPIIIEKMAPPNETPNTPDLAKTQFHPSVLERLQEAEKFKPKRVDLFCPNHPDEPGEVMCAICDRLYCRNCIKPFKSLHFCKEHLPLVMKHDWEEVLTLKTSTENPEEGVQLYDLKKNIFENEQLATYIETHYKINIDRDHIETYLVLFAIKEEKDVVSKKLDFFRH